VEIVLVGDSNAQGYWDEENKGWFGRLAGMCAEKYPRQHGFLNYAYSGDRTLDAYHRLSHTLSTGAELLIIMVGSNDIIRWGTPQAPTDFSPEMRWEAWNKLLNLAETNFEKILVVLSRPVDESKMPFSNTYSGRPLFYTNADKASYNREIAGWCQEKSIPTLDVFRDWLEQDLATLNDRDGIHHSAAGHQRLAEQVFNKLEELKWLS
jgi:lysophospholipase L1-like esterase